MQSKGPNGEWCDFPPGRQGAKKLIVARKFGPGKESPVETGDEMHMRKLVCPEAGLKDLLINSRRQLCSVHPGYRCCGGAVDFAAKLFQICK